MATLKVDQPGAPAGPQSAQKLSLKWRGASYVGFRFVVCFGFCWCFGFLVEKNERESFLFPL